MLETFSATDSYVFLTHCLSLCLIRLGSRSLHDIMSGYHLGRAYHVCTQVTITMSYL